jgi:hypothetical protein
MYITVVSFLIGCLFTGLIRKVFKIQLKETLHFSFVCINGFLFTSFIVSTWLLFYKVDLLANIFLLLLSVSSFFINKKEIAGLVKIYSDDVRKTSKAIWLFFLLFVFVMACISYMPSSHADDSGCFSPAIKWIQEYGTVPGIANLDARLGYNSTWFDLQALFGFAFLKMGLFNDLNGLLFLYVLIYSLYAIDKLLKGESSFINYFKAFFFLPVLFIYFGFSHDIMLYSIQFFTSPTYDIPVTFILWMLFFLFLELKELKTPFSASIRPYLVILYSAYLITIKLNAIPTVILAVFILAVLLKERKYRNALIASCFCIFIAVPWIIKTVVSCGYLLFPFVELDVLNVDWKLTPHAVLYIENSVMTWAIDPNLYGSTSFSNDQGYFSAAIKDWFPVWFNQQNYINTIIFFITIFSGLTWLSIGIISLLKHKKEFFRKHIIDFVFAITILTGILFWFTKGPAPRYGYGYLLFLCMLSLSRFIYFFVREFHSGYTATFMLAYVFYALIYYGTKIQEPFTQTFFKQARAIVSPEYSRQQLGEGKYINVVKEPACGNAPLPSSPKYVYEFLQPAYRGKTIKEGFINRRPAEEYKIEK